MATRERRRLVIHRKDERRIMWPTVFIIIGIHLAALLALDPQYYSTSGLVLFIVLYYVAGMFGVTMSYHRLLTHRSFQTYKWVEYLLTYFACLALQTGPIQWTAMHRIHHKEADHQPDPHSPLVGFLWAHAGWLFVTMPDAHEYDEYCRFAKDLNRDPIQRFFDRHFFTLYAATAGLIYLAGEVYGGLGLSWLVWGVLLRTVALWHATWLVNSATHLWGYRNYQTDEDSTNNWWVALLSFGEGWHNNHHADQRSAAHGQRWFEFDLTYRVLRIMEFFGLVWNVMEPRKKVIARRVDIMVDDEALQLADKRALNADGTLHTLTDPTVPIEVPQMSSVADAYEAAKESAHRALEAAETALRHAKEAAQHTRLESFSFEKLDQAVRKMLETAKDMAMTAVEQAKIGAAEAAEFSAQAANMVSETKDRASETAKHFSEQSRALAQEAADAAARAAEEISISFQGVTRAAITAI